MSQGPSLGVAALLASFPLTGIIGVDKYYAGATMVGVIQTILSLTVIGILITGPWSAISAFALAVAVFTGGMPFLYPNVKWAPVKDFDKIAGGVAIGLIVLSVVVAMLANTKTKTDKKENK